MLILGPDLHIRRFTTIAEKLFNLIPTDIGRPITEAANPARAMTDIAASLTETVGK